MGYTERRPKGDYRWVPEGSGIYRLYHGDTIVYVGQTISLRARLAEHERSQSHWGSYAYKSTPGTTTKQRLRMEDRAIAYNRPNRNRPRT